MKDADDDLRLRVFVEQYDKAIRDEIPLAIDVVKRAQFFLLVLDEDVPEAAAFADGGPHHARRRCSWSSTRRACSSSICKDNKPILRLRRSGGARFIQAGERVVTDDETRDAMQRQVEQLRAGEPCVETALRSSP